MGGEMKEYSVAVSSYKLTEKIPPGAAMWKDFNASFISCEVKPQELMSCLYMGRPITTPHKNKWRATANYECGQHIGLDFDSGDKLSTVQHLASDKFVSKYASFIHTTISHIDEHPRARVIFLIDQPIMQAKNYAMAAAALLWLFGAADRQCKDPARFFYGAPGCTFEFIDQVLPISVIKKLIVNYIESGENERKQSTRSNYLPPASQQEVSEALKFIDPWKIAYDEWVSILMAIHSQFGDGGYQLAESWGAGKPGEVEQKWKSFKPDGNVSGAVTIATLFQFAKLNGWGRNNAGVTVL
jgi:hypothetical protein